MRGVGLCVYLVLLLTESAMCQGRGLGELQGLPEGGEEGEGQEMERDLVSVNILNRHGLLGSYQPVPRRSRSRRPPPPAPKRSPPGSRYALSLDVPTNILNVLIDLAKNRELRTKAAANAELMARIGRRK
ncbi:urocortin-3-like [Anguilla rostrata]|uniref:urocortin-3-like n=1 Tax=Anguilla anguilla TaxID=7936 RepID=UPI0015B33B9D|nr:urocortin-3-like [Anguilla anguilla]XP_035238606.1 urocortin-3-like [Anguilla anguilla]